MKHVRSLKAVMFISGGLTALLLGACNDSDSGPLSTENPMTPNKLAERIVQKNHSQNTNNPLTSANCSPREVAKDGSGSYECTLNFESGGMSWPKVLVNPDGSWQYVK
jgi:hypothetical protein